MRARKYLAVASATLLVALFHGAVSPPGSAEARTEAPTSAPSPSAPTTPDLTPYQGLGVWIDIYDAWAFRNPVAAVTTAKSHGVQTLFVETSNYSRPFAVFEPAAMARLIKAAHVRGMDVVAWYLPGFLRPAFDFHRSMAAINFHGKGQSFDSFGLDIESSAVDAEAVRSSRLIALSRRISDHVPDTYPLSAIIPSPLGMQLVKGYWEDFPYLGIAPYYDVWQPMTYYTYRVSGRRAVYDYTQQNTDILRTETGNANLPIHQIGGIASQSSGLETAGFVDALLDDSLMGGSIYDMFLSGPEDWKQLHRLVP